MSRSLPLLLLAILVGASASADVAAQDGTRVASPAAIDALSGIDFLPTSEHLRTVLEDDLSVLATLAEEHPDPGVRLRAIRSLGQLNADITRAALLAAVERHQDAREGTEVLYLIAAVEALGAVGTASDVSVLAPFLDAASRDVRAATARALADTGSAAACQPLRLRQSQEPPGAVRLAIEAAILTVCP